MQTSRYQVQKINRFKPLAFLKSSIKAGEEFTLHKFNSFVHLFGSKLLKAVMSFK